MTTSPIQPGTYRYTPWEGDRSLLVQVRDDRGEMVAVFDDPIDMVVEVPVAEMAGALEPTR